MASRKVSITGEGVSDIYVAGGIIVSNKNGVLSRYDNYKSPYRPVTLSELFNKLGSRGWNIADRKFIDNSRKLRMAANSGDDRIMETGCYTVSPSNELAIGDRELDLEDINNFEVEHSDIIQMFKNMKESKTVYLYNTSELIFDILNDSVTMDLVGSDQYISTLSLENLFKRIPVSGISAKVDLSIKYSKNNQIYNHNMVFEAFRYPETPDKIVKYTGNNFIKLVNDEVSIEYIDSVIRVIPDKPEIDECIISNCTVTYGNL